MNAAPAPGPEQSAAYYDMVGATAARLADEARVADPALLAAQVAHVAARLPRFTGDLLVAVAGLVDADARTPEQLLHRAQARRRWAAGR